MNSFADPLWVIVGIFMLVVSILWVLLPFAVFAIRSKLEALVNEAQRTNALLSQLPQNTDSKRQLSISAPLR
jgi:CBS domain containing-hemolysin-like protein